MAKWTCKCGYPMNDHKAPDKNYYRIYSDVEWNEIETNSDGNLNFMNDIPKPTYDAYKCPECGRITLFGENGICEFYKVEKDEINSK